MFVVSVPLLIISPWFDWRCSDGPYVGFLFPLISRFYSPLMDCSGAGFSLAAHAVMVVMLGSGDLGYVAIPNAPGDQCKFPFWSGSLFGLLCMTVVLRAQLGPLRSLGCWSGRRRGGRLGGRWSSEAISPSLIFVTPHWVSYMFRKHLSLSVWLCSGTDFRVYRGSGCPDGLMSLD